MRTHSAEISRLEAAGVLISDERPEPTLADRLADEGYSSAEIADLEAILDAEADRRGREQAARFVEWLTARLRGSTAAGAALAVVLAPNEEGVSDLALRLNCSKQNVGNYLPRLRALLPEVATIPGRPAVRRPELEGVWLTRPEAKAKHGVTLEGLQRLGVHVVTVGQTHFVEEGDLLARVHADRVARARERLAKGVR